MPYSSTAFRLLISCPGDLPQEDVDAVAWAVARWNAIYGEQFGAVVVALNWRDHSAAEHGIRPQASLNAQLVNACDILIALFWARLGSETGEAESGTVEEIEEARTRGAYVGILRCSRDVPLGNLDAQQVEKLATYLQRVESESLILQYADEADLARHVDAIINRAVSRSEARGEAVTEAGPGGASVWPRVVSSLDSHGNKQWQLVLANTGAEPARNVVHRLEPENEGDMLPDELDGDSGLESLAPAGEAPYYLAVHMGIASQFRCVVAWEDSAGEHENTATVRLF